MSLFPAYNTAAEIQNERTQETSWLTNSSFATPLVQFQAPDTKVLEITDSSDETGEVESSSSSRERTPKRKKKKEKKESKRRKIETDSYVVDTNRDLGFLNMNKQAKMGMPRYQKPTKALPGVIEAKMMMFSQLKVYNRYFHGTVKNSGQCDETLGEDLKKRVEELNKAVDENPQDVESWKKLVDFQDDYFKFQPIQFKTSGDRDRAVSNQKLTILERAITANPSDMALQRNWLQIAQEFCPVDEVENKISNLLTVGSDSILLCLGKVMLTQFSVARCTCPATLKAYCEVIERVQRRAKHLTGEQQDAITLELFFHACTFLQQCGLREMVWAALNLVLSLNLNIEIPDVCATDEDTMHDENKILDASSGVPVWHLWMKLENFRQGHHFLPVASSENFPQRVVTPGEVSELVYHTRRSAHFRLLMIMPLLANVPILPRSHTLLSCISSELSPWLFDSVEWQLSSIFTSSPLLKFVHKYLVAHLPIAHPPQYLVQQPGQQEFFNLTLECFASIMNAVTGRQKVAFGCWYLRYIRWLDELERLGRHVKPEGALSKKDIFKQFLGLSQNREELLFYLEYGLWEFQVGKTASSIKTFTKLVASRGDVLSQIDVAVKTDLCALYRTLCELQIASGQREEAVRTLQRLCNAPNVALATQKLRTTALEGMAEAADLSPSLEDHFLPCWVVDWAACYAMFLALQENTEEGLNFLSKMASTSSQFVRERLLEAEIGIRRHFYRDKTACVVPVAAELLKMFPFNAAASNAIANSLVSAGGLWWKNLAYLVNSPANLNAATAVCTVMERQVKHGSQPHRVRALLNQLTRGRDRTSSVVHRMKLAQSQEDPKELEKARVLALETYPWNKSVYMECISTSPPQLLPLTDLFVEKDIRIHITPDEIEAMRD